MRQGKCVHFNGTVNDCCEAGVNYRQLAGPGEAWGTRLPCLAKYATAPDVATCAKRQEPTAEQVAESERAIKESMKRVGKAREAIVAHLGGPWKKGARSEAGEIDCPNCEGRLRFSRAGYNGHIHAACSTEGCVAWME